MTLPIVDNLEVSIFTALTHQHDKPFYINNSLCQMLSEDFQLFQFVIHPVTKRAKHSNLTSEYSSQSLEIGSPVAESQTEEYVYINKIGGKPFYYRNQSEVLDDSSKTLGDGFVHYLQIGFPGPNDQGTGDWPFFNCMFHVFVKRMGDQMRFRYMLA